MNRNLKQFIRRNYTALISSKRDLKAIFEIMFSSPDNILCEGNDGFRTYKYTYSEIYKKILSVSAGLYAKIGATHNYVALEIDNSAEWIIAFWSILLSGNKPYLVNMRYPISLSNSILKTLDIKYVICAKETELNAQGIDISSLYCDLAPISEDVFEDEIAFSSSATSMNEVVCFYSGYQISEQILNFKSIIKQNPRIAKHYKGSLKQLAFLPFYHVFGLFAVYFWFTFFGRTLVFLRDYSADTILGTCKRHKVTHIFAVPMLWHTIEQQLSITLDKMESKKKAKFQKGAVLMTSFQNKFPILGPQIAKWVMREVTDRLFGPSVCFCISGGSYLRDSAITLFNSIGYPLHNGYGMSEIGITSVELRNKPKFRNLNSIGKPFDSVEYKIDDNGTLLVKGSSLCKRKLVNGKEVILDNDWFNTGDCLKTDQNGYYYILGRNSDIVIGENGENINPDTIEQHFKIENAKALCVLGINNQNSQELSIVVQINRFIGKKITDKIIQEVYKINETLPSSLSIRKFYFTFDALANESAVKVSRKQLLEKISLKEVLLIPFNEINKTEEKSEELSPLMLEIRKIIAENLCVSPEAVTANSHICFDLGATSIQYFSILSALSEKFQISEYNNQEKYCYTLKEIADYIEGKL